MSRVFVVVTAMLALFTAGLSADQSGTRAKTKSEGPTVVNGAALPSTIGKLGFDGSPSTLVGCAGGNYYATYPLGTTVRGTRIKVDILSGDGIDRSRR